MQNSISVPIDIPFPFFPIEKNMWRLYLLALEKLSQAGENVSDISDGKTLLRKVGFAQNGRHRIIHLSEEEMSVICDSCPIEQEVWKYFVNELETVLRKMDSLRKLESSIDDDSIMGRPYMGLSLARAVSKLATLRYLNIIGKTHLPDDPLWNMLRESIGPIRITDVVDSVYERLVNKKCKSISIVSTIQMMELYCDELIAPPRLKARQTLDKYDQQMMDAGDVHWMDDGGESAYEAIRDVPAVTYYDELPHFTEVLDWFLATRPSFDKNQLRQGWTYLESKSKEWHEQDHTYGYYEDNLSLFPKWSCILESQKEKWLELIPSTSRFNIVPLTSVDQLLAESKEMHNCVVSYTELCLSGKTRIFSVRDSYDRRVATAELANNSGIWQVVQLKGPHNAELIFRLTIQSDLMSKVLRKLAHWYNLKRPEYEALHV